MRTLVDSLKDVFAVIKPDQSAAKVTVTPSIYQDLDANFDHFKSHQLVSVYSFSEDWPTWEVHPKGDEIVVLLSGRITFVLDSDGEHQEVELCEQGDYVVVPKDTWHTAKTNTPSKVLFITPGEGTEHREK